MNGITYYRLKSDYPGDYTKNCALNGTEVDNNFYVLEGRDVKSIAVDGKDILVTLLNGDVLTAAGVLDFVKQSDMPISLVSVEFDKLNGVLKLTNTDGTIQYIEGFATNENTDFSVSTDNTLCGDGLRNAPLGVAPSARTGQYKTVKSIINIAEGGSLPSCGNILGDRYVTCEDVSDYGYLYDYKAVREIACELKNTGWRIPTKADWDDLLNSVEPCDCDKTHDKADKNKFLGKWAGKLLKSKTMWRDCDCCNSCDCCDCDCNCEDECNCKKKSSCNCENDCTCGQDTCFDYSDDPCVGTKESESKCKCEDNCKGKHQGLDAFGFRVTPAGYADDGCNFCYFKERSAFWTGTTDQNNTKAYIKRFQYNKDGVYQDVIASNYHLSLRLVKDYDGKNYFDVEEILDMEYPTLLLPSLSKGKTIWTSCNLACANASLCPMLPNNGQGLTYTRHFFINEWNGFKWVRNEMKQGDTVTVEKAPKGKKMVEYRVIGNEFVSVNEMIYNDVMTDVRPIIENLEEKITERIELVEKSVEAEREDRIAADEALQEAIDTEKAERIAADEALQEAINTEKAERVAADEALQEAIDTEKAERVAADEALQEAIDTEKAERIAADEALQEAIDTEKAERIAADEALQEAINTEKAERVAADEEIEGKLLTQEGTEFDPNSGELTLKSAAGTNDIKVQFAFNFGEF